MVNNLDETINTTIEIIVFNNCPKDNAKTFFDWELIILPNSN